MDSKNSETNWKIKYLFVRYEYYTHSRDGTRHNNIFYLHMQFLYN